MNQTVGVSVWWGEGSGADDGWVWGSSGWSCDNELQVSEEEEFY